VTQGLQCEVDRERDVAVIIYDDDADQQS
jgi:hypothetical protein